MAQSMYSAAVLCQLSYEDSTVAHNCHGKKKNLTAKRKTSRQKEKDSRQKEKPHGKKKKTRGKKKNLTAKRKRLTAKFLRCREDILILISFAVRSRLFYCREVILFAVGLFPFAVRFFFCRREVFLFAVRFKVVFLCVVRFFFVPWG